MPPIGEGFRGRNAETKALADIIDTYPWTIIYGISGIGKTNLVSEVVRNVRFAGRDVIWIHLLIKLKQVAKLLQEGGGCGWHRPA